MIVYLLSGISILGILLLVTGYYFNKRASLDAATFLSLILCLLAGIFLLVGGMLGLGGLSIYHLL